MSVSIDPAHIIRSRLPDIDIPDISVGQFIKQHIDKVDPDKVALINVATDQQLTYGQLNRNALSTAATLLQLGVGTNKNVDDVEKCDRAMFYAENSFEYYVTHLALNYLSGRIPITHIVKVNGQFEVGNFFDEFLPTILVISSNKLPTIHQILMKEKNSKLSTIKLLIILDEHPVDLPPLNFGSTVGKIIKLNELIQIGSKLEPLKTVPHFPHGKSPMQDNYLILYTSGSTGAPKGVIHSHRSFISTILNLGNHFKLFRDFSGKPFSLGPYTMGHISGILFPMISFTRGITVCMLPNVTPEVVFESIQRYKIAALPISLQFSVDFEMNYRRYSEKYDLSSIKIIMFGSTKYPKHVVESLREQSTIVLEELYGSTEAIGSVSNYGPLDEKYPYGSVGQPLPGVQMMILDQETRKSLPANKIGEICFRGSNNFVGYLYKPEVTAETIDQDGWYHTGDAGYYDDQGRLFVVDRIKEMYKYKSWTVLFSEIEAFLYTHPAVEAVCAVPVPHQYEGGHIRAYVQLRTGRESTTEQELADFVKKNLGYQNRLNGGVQFVQEFPRTSIGKVNRPYFKNLVKDELITEPAELD